MENKTRWYKQAVFYQIYPRSFKDSNGDGIGDIQGIISKLDYLKDLGVDALWLSPCYKSPNDDNGYDISDYRDIMDEFGTLDDFKEMVRQLKARGMRLIMDLVVNHTSDEHEWFKQSKDKSSTYRDYYFWRKGKGKSGKKPPNNWTSQFVGKAWEKVDDEYYLHLFSKKQPDLNWDNPKVRQEVIDICEFWFNLGVDGFRCDVISFISKPKDLRNSKELLSPIRGNDCYVFGENWDEYINEVARKSWDLHDSYIVGECPGKPTKIAPRIYGESKHRLDSLFSFEHMNCDAYFMILPHKLSLPRIKKVFASWQNLPSECYPTIYLENHDQPRSVSRYGDDGIYLKRSAKMLATMAYFLRGTPFIYQGQELGMTNTPFAEDEFKDIMSINILKAAKRFKPLHSYALKTLQKKARDNARTPMQWNTGKNAGFSDGTPWMKINPNYVTINAKDNISDKDSILNYYKKVIALRKKNIELINNGEFCDLLPRHKKLYFYTMKYNDETLLVMANFGKEDCPFKLPRQYDLSRGELLLTNNDEPSAICECLLAYETRVYKFKS